jgi:hypothetical protein
MDPTVSGLGAQSGLIERSLIDQAPDQVAQAAASESRQLVAFAAEMRGVASPALSSSSASFVNPGTLAAELLKRLDPFLEKAHAYGRIAVPDQVTGAMPVPMARPELVLANLNPSDVHPGPARKSFALPVPGIVQGIEGRLPDRGAGGTVEPLYDSIIAELFGSDENFKQWSNDLVGEMFKSRIFDIEFGLAARGLRGATDALSALTRQS